MCFKVSSFIKVTIFTDIYLWSIFFYKCTEIRQRQQQRLSLINYYCYCIATHKFQQQYCLRHCHENPLSISDGKLKKKLLQKAVEFIRI